jgi:hypothetical protein
MVSNKSVMTNVHRTIRQGLFTLPLFTYLGSFAYLTWYHKGSAVFSTIIHEGGRYTLLQTVFYASHFLGHVPVHTVLAFMFTGSYLSLTGEPHDDNSGGKTSSWIIILVLFLAGSLVISLRFFGTEDTLAFILQQKQAVRIYETGGSWNLHLPSTILLFFLIPLYVRAAVPVLGLPPTPNRRGAIYLLCGLGVLIVFTLVINRSDMWRPLKIWSEPRYLAHSVRELCTFPLTYFPIALLLFTGRSVWKDRIGRQGKAAPIMLCLCAVLFVGGLIYQVSIPLKAGIGSLAQKPAFAREGLTVPYLLASHYFEHLLDSIYFALLCGLLYSLLPVLHRLYRNRISFLTENFQT